MTKKTWIGVSVIFDSFAVNLAIIIAFYLRFLGKPPALNFGAYTKLAIFITFIYLVAAYLSSTYSAEELLSTGFFESIFKALAITWLFLGVFIWFYRAFTFPRLVFIISWLFALIFIYSWRFVSLNVLKIRWPKQRIVIVGTKPIAKDILEKLKDHKFMGYEVSGVVADANIKSFENTPILGKTDDIPEIVNKYEVDRIIITRPLKTTVLEKLAQMGLQDLRIEVVPDLYEILVGRIDYSTLTDIPLLELTRNNNKTSYRYTKRAIDIGIAIGGLLVSALFFIPIGLAIKLTSKGPIFYKQKRVGLNEKEFTVIKLRTMYVDAEEKSGPVLAKANDNRVTPLGRILRKYRLDELPQLFNILKGEMSFVGPRPERLEFVTKFKEEIPGYAARFRLQPGATGLAQISGSYTTDFKNKLKFDLFYLYHRSLWLDIRIILKTLRVMISGTGSH